MWRLDSVWDIWKGNSEVMKITLITVGKIKERYLRDAVAEYVKRLGKYCKLEIIETADMGETDFRSLIEGDRKYRQDDDLGAHGYTEQEFQGDELIDVEEEESEEDDFDMDYEPEDDDFGYDDLSDDE